MIFNNMKRILFVTHNQFISIETKLPPCIIVYELYARTCMYESRR